MISIIAAIGKNRELGKDNSLLWHIPEDLKRFKKLTSGHVVIMGRKTFQSLPVKPLPNRKNIVITRENKFNFPGILVYNDFYKAINDFKNKDEEIFIIGGQSIYNQAINIVDKLYLTIIEKEYPEADVYFPKYENNFRLIKKEIKKNDNYQFSFLELIKI